MSPVVLLVHTHPLPLLQIRARAESLVTARGDDQRPNSMGGPGSAELIDMFGQVIAQCY